MHNVVIDEPYQFIPPHLGTFWPNLLQLYVPRYLKKGHGVENVQPLHLERLEASMHAGHGVMLTPNHCRPCDPIVLGKALSAVSPLHTIASWHVFKMGRFQAWLLPRIGAFSIHREGLDREALKCAASILTEARRPLVVFPEGVQTRTNDRLNPLMDGAAFIARQAAKHRAAQPPSGKVVVHPIAIRYVFHGDVEATLTPVLTDIEKRLSWQPQTSLSLPERIMKVGDALLTLKELEYAAQSRSGSLPERLAMLIEQLLEPLEAEWLNGKRETHVTARVKALRTAILPDLLADEISEDERAERWVQLSDIYLATQLQFYSGTYFDSPPTPEQMLETVERFEENLTDVARPHPPIHAMVDVGEAIEVNPKRVRGAVEDPLMASIRSSLESMLATLKSENAHRNI